MKIILSLYTSSCCYKIGKFWEIHTHTHTHISIYTQYIYIAGKKKKQKKNKVMLVIAVLNPDNKELSKSKIKTWNHNKDLLM